MKIDYRLKYLRIHIWSMERNSAQVSMRCKCDSACDGVLTLSRSLKALSDGGRLT